MAKRSQEGWSVDFGAVFAAEAEELRRRRSARAPGSGVTKDNEAPIGLALSGGGIRSAATCLGAIQAIRAAGLLSSFDYLSSVSGGGYIGACLSAALSAKGGKEYPFGDDVRDSAVVSHLRNYSNYLLPRNRSAIRNWAEAAAILLRGLLANAVCVLAFLLPAVALTALAHPKPELLGEANFLPRLLLGFFSLLDGLGRFMSLVPSGMSRAADALWHEAAQGGTRDGPMQPFLVPLSLGAALALLLILWAMLRSVPRLDRWTSDTASGFLAASYPLLIATSLCFLIDLLPLAVRWLEHPRPEIMSAEWLQVTWAALIAFGAGVSSIASNLGKFLQTSKRSQGVLTTGLRFATHFLLLVAGMIVPLLIAASYLSLCAWVIPNGRLGFLGGVPWFPDTRLGLILLCWGVTAFITLCVRSNGYSLHRLYRDRLSKAFLVSARETCPSDNSATDRLRRHGERAGDLPPLDHLRLSDFLDSEGPYPLFNAALNLQGSLEANKRGRDADFFIFSPLFVGSELTRYAGTPVMEGEDVRIDVASAMAISGAAASANMGGSTIRILSPTLSLLNIRLGYYLKNPLYVGEKNSFGKWIRALWEQHLDRYFLLIEMFNGLTERRRHVYLTDGGHIENLGIYPLLQRKCGVVVVIDAEADPQFGCESLLRVERYARIDLGVRIILPWEQIARHSRAVQASIPNHDAPCDKGPHSAVGRIFYPDGTEGLLLYFKSSLSGDERDYILDYAERHPAFPHESTGDQFFSEEQFEMYRALGFHMLTGFFTGDCVSFIRSSEVGFEDEAAASAAVRSALSGSAAGDGTGFRFGSPHRAL
jgi:hypothetical protein